MTASGIAESHGITLYTHPCKNTHTREVPAEAADCRGLPRLPGTQAGKYLGVRKGLLEVGGQPGEQREGGPAQAQVCKHHGPGRTEGGAETRHGSWDGAHTLQTGGKERRRAGGQRWYQTGGFLRSRSSSERDMKDSGRALAAFVGPESSETATTKPSKMLRPSVVETWTFCHQSQIAVVVFVCLEYFSLFLHYFGVQF